MSALTHPIATIAYAAFIFREVVLGSARVARTAFSSAHPLTPAIVEFPLRCSTDAEVTIMASSITITPGTLVVGIASATETEPPTLFVHSVFDDDRDSILAGLHDMETRLLTMTRGRAAARAAGGTP